MLLGLALRLGWRRRKVSSLLLVLKTSGLVRPIAEWLARGVAATAKRDCGSTAKAVRLAFHIDEFDFPFDAQGPVTADCDFCWWHLCSQLTEETRHSVLQKLLTVRILCSARPP